MDAKIKSLRSQRKKRLPAKEEKSQASNNLKFATLDYSSTHEDIVKKCQKGDRQAQFELYRLYSKAMYNICLRMVRDELDAEDMLQQSFCDVFRKLDTFRFQSSIGAWIKRIVVNNCINFLKRKKVYFEELDTHHGNISDEPEVMDNSGPQGLSVGAIKKALFDLPDGYRVVFSLYMLEGYDHKEIGDILGVSEATSKSQYSRAKKKLKDILQTNRLASNY